MAKGHVVVGPGQTIASDWGNTVWNQSVQTFASAADRTSQYPTPLDGAMSYLEDTDNLYVYSKGAWLIAAPGAVSFGASASVTIPANTDYGVGPMTVTESPWLISPLTDGIRIERSGHVILSCLFYIPSAVDRTGWAGLSGNPKLAVNWVGATPSVDRLSVGWIASITAPGDIFFGQRAGTSLGTTFAVKGLWFPK